MHRNPFDEAELARRLAAVRRAVEAAELDAAVLSSPENIFYLTGLDHWGYFAPHMLLVPLDRRPVLVTRAMERVAIANMVRNAEFRGHPDSGSAALTLAGVLGEMGLARARLGFEAWSSGLPHAAMATLLDAIEAPWTDISGLVDAIREVKSPTEQRYLRDAAAATDAGTAAAVAAVRAGANEHEIAAECLAAMTRAGSEPPGFGPFLRPRSRMGEEHTTWGHTTLGRGEKMFLEIAGCVARYNTPNGRFVHVGEPPEEDVAMAELALGAYRNVLGALRPGAAAHDVYAAWQEAVDEAGLPHYRRQHCGYSVGIAFPPSWTGGNRVLGLRDGSDMEVRAGMSFHVMSWLADTGRGDFFLSNLVLLTAEGPEELTRTPLLPFASGA